mmetsp:Transcript_127600/g.318635  ORF Transcript_127600/g.318635 Transcript_127600/m.318635 type:complete len:557 (-) Transcript_127600:156-1826(-)|eukprot:CAMPEP_0115246686 /NCGR_PEP_ID=MMETSP0270-20121206/41158_1 /TAXON_ID=71861 /ORGANISM="Scrippsiella trochoidea, Strain CCMP3099" /LENGTH=556 /DNA_ID=CAMNT_0002661915 /DNA_START=96 /DNA_END=1766 /DNA_ORIENTATION=+
MLALRRTVAALPRGRDPAIARQTLTMYWLKKQHRTYSGAAGGRSPSRLAPISAAQARAPRNGVRSQDNLIPCDLAQQSRGKDFVRLVASTTVPSSWGPLPMVAFESHIGDILVVVNGVGDGHCVPIRVHDACLTGEVFGSLKCDCGPQLQMALAIQTKQKLGMVIYMPQEGRGIGLANKIAAYHMQEKHGLDTVDANLALGLPAEMRDYSVLSRVFEDLGVQSTLLMTNNPYKVEKLRAAGVSVKGTLPLVVSPTSQVTSQYLEAKRKRMGHELSEAQTKSHARPPALDGPAAALLETLHTEIRSHESSSSSNSRPFALLSFATSMDGFIAEIKETPDGGREKRPVALSGEASNVLTHHLRGAVDAILVGVGTALTDNPLLNVRQEGAGPSPQPVVLDSQLRLPPDCRLLTAEVPGGRPPTIVLCTCFEGVGAGGGENDASSSALAGKAARAAALRAAGAVVLQCRADGEGRVCLKDAWRVLRESGVRSLMIEGGAEVIMALLLEQQATKLVDRLIITQASAILGSGVSWASRSRPKLLEAHSFPLGQDAILAAKL